MQPFTSPLSTLLLLAACSAPTLAAEAPACPPAPATPAVAVSYVIDGDTLVLGDGRHVRLIGINAMELGHEGTEDQPYAVAARDRLRQLLKRAGGKLGLEPGAETYDEHGRSLAYVFGEGGEDLGLQLIREGLAVVVAVPPDLGRLDCYAAAEAKAREAHLGIWSAASPLVTATPAQLPSAGTFLILKGLVTRVSRQSAGERLLLDGRLPVWIAAADLPRFTADPARLEGRRVLVRGWVRDYKGTLELDVHAPAALLALTP
jgi:endonuclease YncB( thermonuclease family)